MLDPGDLSQRNVIYALHAGDFNYRYVGMTTRKARDRLSAHRLDARKGGKLYKDYWIRKVGIENVQMEVLQICDPGEINDWETIWIYQLSEMGYRLTNLTTGGEGATGWKPTEEYIWHRVGGKSWLTKLSDSDVEEIWSRMRSGEHYLDIASDYSISPGTINSVLRGETWKHCTPEDAAEIRTLQKSLGLLRVSSSMSARVITDEIRDNMRQAASARVSTANARRKISLSVGKLTESQVMEILIRLNAGESQAKISKDYGVNGSTISNISRGITYKWITSNKEKEN